ncbi:MAG: bifunctional phosphopantothenoylcysteine decarboxylase/phosphopantothenate--cysteine ligase CoaBC, partial [Salinisphaeraceae bacterium]|nr:bifunctional phosphopantothenoylcysteine decarboxylase/phosphopantothenate--cysteine ligase CoaBC [Salinisphaeraceae bacterium]
LARWADLILIAPASADFIARLAQGRADDLLTTLCLATDAPIAVAPAMNRLMWANAATQANVQTLAGRNVAMWGPGQGDQACGEVGEGRMLEPLELVAHVADYFGAGLLDGRKVLITAGPTREPIDPVRFITNRSSGRMGYAIAEACAAAGAEVTLVSGPVNLPTPTGVTRIDVETAEQMHAAVMDAAGQANILVATAAVADYRPNNCADAKIKKDGESLQIGMTRNADILADAAARFGHLFTVGFAAETDNLKDYARGKLQRKGLDMVAANWVGEGRGFDRNDNALWVCWPEGEADLQQAPKKVLARQLVELISQQYTTKKAISSESA